MNENSGLELAQLQ